MDPIKQKKKKTFMPIFSRMCITTRATAQTYIFFPFKFPYLLNIKISQKDAYRVVLPNDWDSKKNKKKNGALQPLF